MNCDFNSCRGRGLAAGHHKDCPNLIPQESESRSSTSMEPEDLKDTYHPDEAGCDVNHPRHGVLSWTGCYIKECRIHTNKPYQPKLPSYVSRILVDTFSPPPTDLHLDVVAGLATKRDPTGTPSHRFDHTLVRGVNTIWTVG